MKYIDNKLRTLLIAISTITVIIAAVLLLKTISKDKYIDKKEPVLSYSNKAVVNYNVSLAQNPLYEQKILGEGNIYLSDYVDKINTTLNYSFKADKNVEVLGQYEIIALLESSIGSEKDIKNILTKRFVLQDKTDFKFDSSSGNLKKDLPISLKSYNELIQQINKSVNLNLNSKLTIIWNISISSKTDAGAINEQLSPRMEIPLSNKYFEIEGKLSQEKKGAIEAAKKVISPKYTKSLIAYITILVIGILVFLYTIFLTKPEKSKKISTIKIKRILKDHKERLVALKDEPIDGSETIIRVVEMEDLLKIADELDKPIFYIYSSNEDEIRSFYVIENKKVFMFEVI